MIGKPTFIWNGRTIAGVAGQADEIERGLHLRQEAEEKGDTITVRGRMRLLTRPASVVNGVFVPQWDEIRIEQR
jgi:hypothetical protein